MSDNIVQLRGPTPNTVLAEALSQVSEMEEVIVIARIKSAPQIGVSQMSAERALWLVEYAKHVVWNEGVES